MYAIGGAAGGRLQRAQRIHHRYPAAGVAWSLERPRAQVGDEPDDVGFLSRNRRPPAGIGRRHIGRRRHPDIPHAKRLRAGRHRPGLFELDSPVAGVLHRVKDRRRAGGGGDKLHVKIAAHDFYRGALGGNTGIVHSLKTGPTDGHDAVETRAIGFVKHILNGGERRPRERGRRQAHCRERQTYSLISEVER